MKQIFIASLICLLLTHPYALFAQDNGPQEVTPALQQKITATIEKQAAQFRTTLSKAASADKPTITFTVDTFKIEQYIQALIKYDYSTAGMNSALYEGAQRYDNVLNKYYQQLMGVLKKEDKQILIQAQRAWITFRDNETKLTGLLGNDRYSGGGTLQSTIDADAYLALVRQRTIALFQHFMRTQPID